MRPFRHVKTFFQTENIGRNEGRRFGEIKTFLKSE